jgi:hypothetical protein
MANTVCHCSEQLRQWGALLVVVARSKSKVERISPEQRAAEPLQRVVCNQEERRRDEIDNYVLGVR